MSLASLLARLYLARRFAHRSAAVKPSFIFALFSDAESRVVFAPRLPAFALLLVDTGMTIVYNVKVTPERYQDKFGLSRRFVSDKSHAQCPTTDTVPLLPRGSIIDRDGTS